MIAKKKHELLSCALYCFVRSAEAHIAQTLTCKCIIFCVYYFNRSVIYLLSSELHCALGQPWYHNMHFNYNNNAFDAINIPCVYVRCVTNNLNLFSIQAYQTSAPCLRSLNTAVKIATPLIFHNRNNFPKFRRVFVILGFRIGIEHFLFPWSWRISRMA